MERKNLTVLRMKDISIELDRKKCMAGILLVMVLLLLFREDFALRTSLVFIAMFAVLGALRVRTILPWLRRCLNFMWSGVCIFTTAWAVTLMDTSTAGFFQIGTKYILANCAIVACVCLLLFLLLRNWVRSICVASVLLTVFGMINGFVVLFRGNEINPMDILSARTAMNVVAQYTFYVNGIIARGCILMAVVWFSKTCIPKENKKSGVLEWTVALAVLIVMAAGVWKVCKDVSYSSWLNAGSVRNGFLLNFVTGFRYIQVDEPEGYAPNTVKEQEAQYIAEISETEKTEKPNILVIMNESFADLSVFSSELKTNQPVTPFLDSLQENTIRGYAMTSAFGGNTANVEFEFLTGHSMYNMPQGCVPYRTYIKSDTFSLVRVLESYGYTTMATHPYYAGGWDRTTVYPALGFETSTFLEEYPQQDLVRTYVSDREMYMYVLQQLEEKGENPLFLFGVTMQNHGGYEYEGENFTNTIRLEGYDMPYPKTEQYLTLLHESDQAIEYLLAELEDYPEDTIVVFFGDHLPQLDETVYNDLYGGDFVTMNEAMLRYMVPFFIWANFDIQEETVKYTSINYLGRYLLEAAGLELPAYYRFLADMEEQVPAMNTYGYYSVSKGRFLAYRYADGQEAEALKTYAVLQYNALFDSEERSKLFFGRYIEETP